MRGRVALGLTAAMLLVYFGFVLLVAYDRQLLGRTIAPGLSVGIALGAGVIAFAWLLTGIYSRWAASRWDVEVEALRARRVAEPAPVERSDETSTEIDAPAAAASEVAR